MYNSIIFYCLSCSGVTPQAVDAVGEILLSLSYLPTAERLTVVVAKCKNLVWTNSKTTAGQRWFCFFAVYVLLLCVYGCCMRVSVFLIANMCTYFNINCIP